MKKLIKYALGAMLAAGIPYTANAVVSFTLHDEFSGGQQPIGSIKVDFTTFAVGAVDVKITSLLVGTESLNDLYLNLNVAYDPTSLSFAKLGGTGSFTDPTISLGTNAFKADGDGSYDILFDFIPPGPGIRFDNADTVTYRITRTGLVEEDFNTLSQPPTGGHGPFLAAAHIQGIAPNDGSGFIAPNGVPDGGTTVMLLGTALACLGALRRRFA
jgi:hypothetical protein